MTIKILNKLQRKYFLTVKVIFQEIKKNNNAWCEAKLEDTKNIVSILTFQ